jgi:FixJ family two-component response regulator
VLQGSKVIGIVDDDSNLLSATEDLLNARGFVTRTFNSAEEFLARREATHVDCLLLDISLDGMSGLELRCRLRASGTSLPIIFMTAYEDDGWVAREARTDCVALLRKPLSAGKLFDAIEQALPSSTVAQ